LSALRAGRWEQWRRKIRPDSSASRIRETPRTARQRALQPGEGCTSATLLGKWDAVVVWALEAYSTRRISLQLASRETHLEYKHSISWTGPSHPRPNVTLAHPTWRCPRSSSSAKTRLSASFRSWTSCFTTSPASFTSRGAIPHCSVTITGVPDAIASAAVFPKFSFCDGRTKTAASRYAAHLFCPNTGPAN